MHSIACQDIRTFIDIFPILHLIQEQNEVQWTELSYEDVKPVQKRAHFAKRKKWHRVVWFKDFQNIVIALRFSCPKRTHVTIGVQFDTWDWEILLVDHCSSQGIIQTKVSCVLSSRSFHWATTTAQSKLPVLSALWNLQWKKKVSCVLLFYNSPNKSFIAAKVGIGSVAALVMHKNWLALCLTWKVGMLVCCRT